MTNLTTPGVRGQATGTRPRFPAALPPVLVLALGVCLTVLAWHYVDLTVTNREQARFDSAVSLTRGAIEQRMNRYIDVLRGARGLAATGQTIGRAEWAAYVESLDLQS